MILRFDWNVAGQLTDYVRHGVGNLHANSFTFRIEKYSGGYFTAAATFDQLHLNPRSGFCQLDRQIGVKDVFL